MQSTRRDRRTGFHSGFAKPINYHCFSLVPRPLDGYPPVHVKKQIPIIKDSKGGGESKSNQIHLISRRRFFIIGGGAALGAIAALNKASASLIVNKDRPHWRFCQKCYVMFYNGDTEKGSCAAGGAHAAQGYEFFLPFDVPGTPTAQTNWRQCEYCLAMFFNGYQEKGHCPAIKVVRAGIPSFGAHKADDSFRYVLAHDVPGTATAQTNWRYCVKCHAMFFDGYKKKGSCAAGGAHAAQGYNFVLPHDNR